MTAIKELNQCQNFSKTYGCETVNGESCPNISVDDNQVSCQLTQMNLRVGKNLTLSTLIKNFPQMRRTIILEALVRFMP